MKKLITFTISFLLLLTLYFLALQFLPNYHKAYSKYFQNLTIKQPNKFKIRKFPIPSITISDLELGNGINLYGLELSFSIPSLIKLNPKIGVLKINRVNIEQNKDDISTLDYQTLLTTLLSNQYSLYSDLEIKELNVFNKNHERVLKLTNLTSSYDGSNIGFSANTKDTVKISGTIETKKQTLRKMQFNVEGAYYNFQFDGFYNNSQELKGKGKYKIKNLAKVIYSSFPEIQSIFNDLSSNESINVTFDLFTEQNQWLLKNISISSSSIIGQGECNISNNEFLLDFAQINIDKLFVHDSKNNITENIIQKDSSKLLFISKLLKANITVKDLIFCGDNYNNVKFITTPESDKLYIKDFSGKSSKGQFKILGVITQNAYRSIFDGQVYLNHQNLNSILTMMGQEQLAVEKVTPFAFQSDLKATLINLNMQNVVLKTHNARIDGAISFKFIGYNPRVNSKINVSSIHLNTKDYPLISPIWKFILGFTHGTKEKDYLNKFIAIRTAPYTGSFDVVLNDLFIDKDYFGKVSFISNIEPGNIKIDNLYINNGNDYITSTIDLMANIVTPKFNIKINDGSLHVNFLSPKAILSLRNILLTEFDTGKILLNFQCSLSKVFQKDLIVEDIKFDIENTNQLFKISNLSAKALGGTFEGSGSILLDPYTINLVYAFNSIDIPSLSKILPAGFLNTTGTASINGMITTNGDSLERQLYNLYTKSYLVLRDTTINNFSLDDFIEQINDKAYDTKSFDDDVKKTLLTGKTTVDNLTSEILLTKGILSLKNTKFNTKYAAAAAAANISIYNFDVNLASIFSFNLLDRAMNKYATSYNPAKFGLKVEGNLFSPQKTADTIDLLSQLLKK